jgi:NB-ARC domain
MGRPERPLDGTGPIAEFAHDLRELRNRAGNPSYRELARTALYVPSVLSSAASGHRLPTLAVTLAFVGACGGNQAVWEQRWREIATRAGVVESRNGQAPPVSLPPDPPAEAVARPARPRTWWRTGSHLAPPAQLPIGSATFIGRGQELASATRIIGLPGPMKIPLMISGPIGVGKTAFALQLADKVSAEFPDGQLYADISSCRLSSHGIVRGFLRTLGVPNSLVPDDPMERIGLFRSMLAQRRLFVLLENAYDECQVRPFLGRAAHSQVVMTSRARLLGLEGAHRIDLHTLIRQESVNLIGLLVGAERVRTEYKVINALAELCGDLPLALNIIGRKIAARPGWALGYTAKLLADRSRLMDSLSVGDLNVRDRLASAYQLLSPAGRDAIHHLGLSGAEQATAVSLATDIDIPMDSADELLESLVDVGLLTRTSVTGRYGVSTLVSVFAAEAARPSRQRPWRRSGGRSRRYAHHLRVSPPGPCATFRSDPVPER